MDSPLLYSTNVFLKFLIQQRFRNDEHYVWCSDSFDATTKDKYLSSHLIAPSSNPADIYRQLKDDITRRDKHSAKIAEQKTSFKARAIDWEATGEISEDDKNEIIYWVDNVDFEFWKPLLYIIPKVIVEARLKIVPPDKRASLGIEYIVSDLKRHEFDIIEI